MKLLVLTNIYPAPDLEKENTPIVHYFTKEWVKMGVDVRVVHYPANFPKLIMWGASLIKKHLSSRLGTTIRTSQTDEREYELDGVRVKRIPLLKRKLHGAFSEKQLNAALQKTIDWLATEKFTPDNITSHWVNPQIELMAKLKEYYQAKTCYVAHTATAELSRIYDVDSVKKKFQKVDVIGFRSAYIRDEFLRIYGYAGPTFQCYSGIPQQYIPVVPIHRNFHNVFRFVFVGTLIKRKFPAEIVPALVKAMKDEVFEMNYIGKGAEEATVLANAEKLSVADKVHLLGRMSRDEVVSYLQQSDVFIMNSRAEAFGLVYLEAMAQGCITIASRNEGFDGIIKDGENGFLCKAGDVDDLASTIQKIRTMAPAELCIISENAINTARELTDEKAAVMYLEALTKEKMNEQQKY